MGDGPDLVLLTATYPYGAKSETFLENELPVLATRFRRIFILPSKQVDGERPLPDNAEVVPMDWLEEPTSATKYRALASAEATAVLAHSGRRSPEMRRHLLGRLYLDNLAREVLKFRALRRFVHERGLENAIFYSFWLEESALALALLRRSRAICMAVARAHNFDIYEYFWGGRPIPFQSFKGAHLDRVFPVSEAGLRHLETSVPSLRGKLQLEHLGVRAPDHVPSRGGKVPVVVSCSSLIASKRVHDIPAALVRFGAPVRWVHFGDGRERERVEAATAQLGPPIEWELVGHVDNRDVLAWYERHHVDAFLSLSVLEGLPVSMMEAQSYGIPIIACGVGGIPEIVGERTGILLERDPSPDAVAEALHDALRPGRFETETVRASFASNFDAKINYQRFADALIALWKGQTAAD